MTQTENKTMTQTQNKNSISSANAAIGYLRTVRAILPLVLDLYDNNDRLRQIDTDTFDAFGNAVIHTFSFYNPDESLQDAWRDHIRSLRSSVVNNAGGSRTSSGSVYNAIIDLHEVIPNYFGDATHGESVDTVRYLTAIVRQAGVDARRAKEVMAQYIDTDVTQTFNLTVTVEATGRRTDVNSIMNEVANVINQHSTVGTLEIQGQEVR